MKNKLTLVLVFFALIAMVSLYCGNGTEDKTNYKISIYPDTVKMYCSKGEQCTGELEVTNTGERILIDTISAAVQWDIRFNPSRFSMVTNSLQDIFLSVDPYTLPDGKSMAFCSLISSDDKNFDFVVACSLLAGQPKISVEPKSISLTLKKGIESNPNLYISNIGSAVLRVDGISSDQSFITVLDYANISLPINETDTLPITVSSRNLDAGVYLGSVSVRSNDPKDSLKIIAVKCSVYIPEAEIYIQPEQVYITCKEDSVCSSFFVAYNVGTQTVNVNSISTLAKYLSFFPNAFTLYRNSSQQIEVAANTSQLEPGTDSTVASIIMDEGNYLDVPIIITVIKRNAKLNISNQEIKIDVKPYGKSYDTLKVQNIGDKQLIITSIGTTAEWLTVKPNPDIYIEPYGASKNLIIEADGNGLVENQIYQSQIKLVSNDPDSIHFVPVRCSVLALTPQISVNTDTLTINGKTNQDFAPAETLRIGNIGDGNLIVSEMIPEPDWLVISPAKQFSLAPGEAEKIILVTANTSNLFPGIYNGYILIRSNDPSNPGLYVYITVIVEPELHSLKVEPSIIEMTGYSITNFAATDSFLIKNIGDNDVRIDSITANQEWVDVNFTPKTILRPNSTLLVQITANTGNLDNGLHDAWLNVSSNDPGLPVFSIPVKLTVKNFNVVHEKTITSQAEWVLCVSYSNNGQYLAAGTSSNTVLVYNTSDYSHAAELVGHGGQVYDVEFNVDDTRLASGSADNNIIIWNTSNWRSDIVLDYHHNRVRDIAFHPNGNFMASSSDDHSIILWDTRSWSITRTFTENLNDVTSVTFSKDGQYLAAGSWQKIYIWEVKWWSYLTEIGDCTGWIFGLDFSPDLKYLASGSTSEVRIWNVLSWNNRLLTGYNDMVWETTFSPDGKYMATACSDRSVKIWYTASWLELAKIDLNIEVNSVRFSPDGTHIAVGSDDGTIKIYRIE
jgi:WD40 repeat protein